jgi:hypothetical protein
VTDDLSAARAGGYSYRFFEPGDEGHILELLRGSLNWDEADLGDWQWKHLHRPGFSPEDVVVVLDPGGDIIACFHSAILALHLGDGLVTCASVDGDFVVDPRHRGSNIPTPALQLNDARLLRAGVTLRGGFTTEELNRRFYNKRYGYVFVPPSSSNYRRLLTVAALRPAVEKLGARLVRGRAVSALLGATPLQVNLRIATMPPCHVELRADGFDLREGTHPDVPLTLTVPYRLIAARAVTAPRLLRNVATDLALGRIRASGLWRSRHLWPGLAAAVLRDKLRR